MATATNPDQRHDDRQASADRFVATLHRYIDDGPVDLQQPADDLIAALTGAAPDSAIAAALTAGAAIIDRYWSVLRRGSADVAMARTLTNPQFEPLTDALIAALHPFARQDALDAAEDEVRDLQRQVAQANADLEAAVAAGDVEHVMALRATAQVTLPGRLGEARLRVLQLKVDASKPQLSAAAEHYAKQAAAVRDAEQLRDAAAAQLRDAAAALDLAQRAAAAARAAEGRAKATTVRLSEALREQTAAHEHDQQTRIRKLAGLAPTAA